MTTPAGALRFGFALLLSNWLIWLHERSGNVLCGWLPRCKGSVRVWRAWSGCSLVYGLFARS